MDQRQVSIPLPFSKITPVQPINDQFTLVKVYVCYPGKNRNMIYIDQSELDKAIPTLAYVPIVGHLIEELDKKGNHVKFYFGGHDVTVTKDGELKPLTVPFGVVTADEPQYETVVEFGKEKTYLTAYGYLWTGRYPELYEAAYDENTWFGQSMEIHYGDYEIYESDSAYTELHNLTFSALCILGKSDNPKENVRPCFPSARIDPIQFAADTEQFSQAMAEMKEQLSLCFENNTSKKGGNHLETEKILEILASAGLDAGQVDFTITKDMTEDELMSKIQEFKEASNSHERTNGADATPTNEGAQKDDFSVDNPDNGSEDPDMQVTLFSATVNQKREAIRNALEPIIVRDNGGNLISETRYYIEDFDDHYVFVERDYWSADNYEVTHGRFEYVFNDADKTASITSEFEEMVRMWLTKAEAKKIEEDRNELEILRKYKADMEAEKLEQSIDSVFSNFEDLSTLEEYKQLRESAFEIHDINEIEMRLFALRGKQVAVPKAKKATASFSGVKIGLSDEPAENHSEPYGGIFTKYNIGTNR